MKTTKKLLVLCFAAVMTMAAVMPSTFSWYAHNGATNYQGNQIAYNYTKELNQRFSGDGTTTAFTLDHGTLDAEIIKVTINGISTNAYTFNSSTGVITFTSAPESGKTIIVSFTRKGLALSLKQSQNLGMTTYKLDKDSKVNGSEVSSFSTSAEVAAGKTQRYKTTITNNNSNPVYLDLEMSGITNNSKVYVGEYSPAVNEKTYASRATANKITYNQKRVYFMPNGKYDWWETLYSGSNFDTGSDTDCDMNLQYMVGSSSANLPMSTASGTTYSDAVCYADVPSDTTELFFFNHYFLTSSKNKELNRTQSAFSLPNSRVYKLTGSTNSYQNKTFETDDSDKYTNVAVNSYYNTVSLSVNKTASIALTKGTEELDSAGTDYDYTGSSISYTSADTSVATVSQDGLVTAKSSGSTTITTTITGGNGDTLALTTTVTIASTIPQVPIAQNVKVPAGGSVDILWYVKNEDSSTGAGFSNIFYTI